MKYPAINDKGDRTVQYHFTFDSTSELQQVHDSIVGAINTQQVIFVNQNPIQNCTPKVATQNTGVIVVSNHMTIPVSNINIIVIKNLTYTIYLKHPLDDIKCLNVSCQTFNDVATLNTWHRGIIQSIHYGNVMMFTINDGK